MSFCFHDASVALCLVTGRCQEEGVSQGGRSGLVCIEWRPRRDLCFSLRGDRKIVRSETNQKVRDSESETGHRVLNVVRIEDNRVRKRG